MGRQVEHTSRGMSLLFFLQVPQEDLAEIIYRVKGKPNISLGQDMSQFPMFDLRVASIVRACLLSPHIKHRDSSTFCERLRFHG